MRLAIAALALLWTGKAFADAMIPSLAGDPNVTTPPSIIFPVVKLGNVGADAANSTNINSAIQALGATNGGIVRLPCGSIYIAATIVRNVSNVTVQGCGASSNHVLHGVAPTNTPGTQIVPDANFMPLQAVTTQPGTTVNQGGGFQFLTVVDNGLVTGPLETIDSFAGFRDSVTFSGNLASPQLLMTSCVTGAGGLTDACNVQRAFGEYTHLIGSGATIPFRITGSSNANASFNDFTFNIRNNGSASAQIISADNNFLAFYCIASPTPCVEFYGRTAASPVGGESNTIRFISGTSGLDAQGTNTAGVTAGVGNTILRLDNANATPAPTAGTGSSWVFMTDAAPNVWFTPKLVIQSWGVSGADQLEFCDTGATPCVYLRSSTGTLQWLNNAFNTVIASLSQAGAFVVSTLTLSGVPTSGGSGGLYLCVDTAGVTYKKASCP